MIDVKNLSKNYDSFEAVKDVSFFIDKGEVVGFLGPNAAGKTTTMRILTCYMPATQGSVSVAGFDVFDNPMSVKKRVGYLPEHPPLYQEMTVESYLSFVGKIKGLSGKILKMKLDKVLERTSTAEVRSNLIANLSKGFKQRVGLAQALIHDPEVLVLDEPTVGLDPKQIIEVRELIKELGEDHTIILSTHILPEVSATCGRVIIINKGKIVAEDTPENLTSGLQGQERIEIEVDGPSNKVLAVLSKIKGVLKVSEDGDGSIKRYKIELEKEPDVRKAIAASVVNNGWGLLEMKSSGLSLEEIFLQLTTDEEVEA
ncbi:ATP-binding cassette domain-containing protein [Candidatus Marinimicrobia bacterium MT.SAG.3]|nr:ATP-binding cassette domain-containing protein [Candidatus Marinimicrobia bacterium MT.SAG.3]